MPRPEKEVILKLCLSQSECRSRCGKQSYHKSVFYQELAQALHHTSNAEPLGHDNARRGPCITADYKLQSYNNPAAYKFRFIPVQML